MAKPPKRSRWPDGHKKTGNKSLDAALVHGWDHYFDSMVADLEAGNLPHKNKIIRGLRSGNPIPQVVRDFIADLLEGKVSYPRGRPPPEYPEFPIAKAIFLNWGFEAWIRAIERWERIYRRKWPDKKRTAIERAARRAKVSPDTVDRAVYPRN